jgi:hypothetical protein
VKCSKQVKIGPFGNGFEMSNCCSDVTEIQVNLKLFLTTDDPAEASLAIRHVSRVLGKCFVEKNIPIAVS